jgi:hypothetical protein
VTCSLFTDVSKEMYCLHLQGWKVSYAQFLKMAAVRSSETSVNAYVTAWRHIQKDGIFHSYYHENLNLTVHIFQVCSLRFCIPHWPWCPFIANTYKSIVPKIITLQIPHCIVRKYVSFILLNFHLTAKYSNSSICVYHFNGLFILRYVILNFVRCFLRKYTRIPD